MALLRSRLKNSVDRRQSLEGVPRLSAHVRVSATAGGGLALEATVRREPGFLQRFMPAVTERRFELDEFGAFVVRQMEEERTVMEIVKAFEAEFGLSHRESELGVVAFVKMLMKRNLLVVSIDA